MNYRANYRTALLKVTKEIQEDKTSLDAQLKYYEYLLHNIGVEMGRIDTQIHKLEIEKQRLIEQFTQAPHRISEIKKYISGWDFNRTKLLVTPKIEEIKRLRAKLAILEVG